MQKPIYNNLIFCFVISMKNFNQFLINVLKLCLKLFKANCPSLNQKYSHLNFMKQVLKMKIETNKYREYELDTQSFKNEKWTEYNVQ